VSTNGLKNVKKKGFSSPNHRPPNTLNLLLLLDREMFCQHSLTCRSLYEIDLLITGVLVSVFENEVLKPKQKQAVEAFLAEQDVFAILSTERIKRLAKVLM